VQHVREVVLPGKPKTAESTSRADAVHLTAYIEVLSQLFSRVERSGFLAPARAVPDTLVLQVVLHVLMTDTFAALRLRALDFSVDTQLHVVDKASPVLT
jgi:hypothetical protein